MATITKETTAAKTGERARGAGAFVERQGEASTRRVGDAHLALPWRQILRQSFGVWVGMRLAYALALAVFLPLFVGDGVARGGPFGLAGATRSTGISLQTLVALFGRWDAAIYYAPIAVFGYQRPIEAAFWPLYPLLIHLATLVTGASYALFDALMIGNLGSLLACVGVAALVAQIAAERGAVESGIAQRRALALLCGSPFAFWLVMPYTDGLFLGLAACALVAMRRERWLIVGGCMALAALTRPTAVALLIPLLWELSVVYGRRVTTRWLGRWRDALRDALRDGWRPLVALGSVPVALGVWLLYCKAIFGSALAPFDAERTGFGHNATALASGPLVAIRLMVADLRSPSAPFLSWNQVRLWLDAAPPLLVAICLALCIVVTLQDVWLRRRGASGLAASSWRRLFLLPGSLLLYALAIWLITISAPVTGTITPDPLPSAGRYLLAAAPLYLVWARLCARWPWLEPVAWQIGLPLQIILALYVFAGGWLV